MAFRERTYATFTSGPAAVKIATPQSVYAIILADVVARGGTASNIDSNAIWFQVQNPSTNATSIFCQDEDNVANAAVEVTPAFSKVYDPQAVKYGLRDHYIRVGTDDQVFAIEVQFG